ncbi:MAG: hypothetical protein IE919_19725 [Thioclava sp.]|nr:hypothetical protein [Thioclava sp.]MBD3805437.1 hypothetical protein [Thioclava sp.]
MPKLRLKVTHTHAGVVYPAGHVLDVDEYTARWLIDHRIGELASQRPESAPNTHNASAKSAQAHKE